MMRIWFVFGLWLLPQVVGAVEASGTVSMAVTSALTVDETSALEFAAASAGASAETVLPGNFEDPQNGSFIISGEPFAVYTIELPRSVVIMKNGVGGSANSEIVVDAFTSYPPAGSLAMIGKERTQHLFVGATRSPLSPAQEPGKYSGEYHVMVVYQ